MLSIHPVVNDFGNEDETNYETDEINEENMKEFCIFIADQISENEKHTINTTSKPCASFVEGRTSKEK